MLEQDPEKNEMETGAENSERWLIDESCRMEPRSRTNRAIGRPRKRWEVKLEEDETETFIESSSQINKKHGSTQQKTAEQRLCSKKNTQMDFRRTTGKSCENEKEKK